MFMTPINVLYGKLFYFQMVFTVTHRKLEWIGKYYKENLNGLVINTRKKIDWIGDNY